MRSVLGAVDRFSNLLLHLLDHLFDLVLRVANLLLGLASLAICLAFGFKVLVVQSWWFTLLHWRCRIANVR